MCTAPQSALQGKQVVHADDVAADDVEHDARDRCADIASCTLAALTVDAEHNHAICRTHGPVQPAASSDDEDAPAIAGITEDDTSFVQAGLRSAFPMSFGIVPIIVCTLTKHCLPASGLQGIAKQGLRCRWTGEDSAGRAEGACGDAAS